MIEIEFQQLHFMFAVRTFQRIVAEGRKNISTPLVKAAVYGILASGYGTVEFGIHLTMPCIQNSGSGNDWSAKVTVDVFDNCFLITKVWFGINIKSLFVIIITFGLRFFKRRTDPGFQFIQKSSAESIAQKRIIKMFGMTPEAVVTKTAFRNETMNMGIPFEISAECM